MDHYHAAGWYAQDFLAFDRFENLVVGMAVEPGVLAGYDIDRAGVVVNVVEIDQRIDGVRLRKPGR